MAKLSYNTYSGQKKYQYIIKMKPFEKIRAEMIDKIEDKKAKSIVASHFCFDPQIDELYFEHISKKAELLEIYKRWVLHPGPIPYDNDDNLYKLREEILSPSATDAEIIKADRRCLMFLIDILSPYLEGMVIKALSYYELKNTEIEINELNEIIERAMLQSINLCDQNYIEKSGYPSFAIAVFDMFKIIFASKLGMQYISMPEDDSEFVKKFERAWDELKPYSDNLYGFEIIPAVTFEDMLRYLKLPFKNKKYRSLSKTNIYRQVINYIAATATFKPVPDPCIRIYYREELAKLFQPLVDKLINEAVRKKTFLLGQDGVEKLKKEIMLQVPKIIAEFDFFYATTNSLQKKKISPFSILTMPLRGWLVKLGHNASLDEYPLTDYLSKKINNMMQEYTSSDLASDADISLDEELNQYPDDDASTLRDVLSIKNAGIDIPEYDAKDKNGNPIGWKIDTFAGIVNKGSSTLRRWDQTGFLKAERYEINSNGRKTLYRAYTEDDVNKARNIEKIMQKRMKHK